MKKILALVGMLVVAAALLVTLPAARDAVWGINGPTIRTSLPYDPQIRAELETAVEEAMKVDVSHFDRASDLRYVDRLPASEAELEATFRQRKTDAAEKILASESVQSRELLMNLTPRDMSRPAAGRIPSTRRHVMSVALAVADQDRAALPTLSKGQILDFLENNYISLQARISHDLTTGQWRLHHRPLAAQTTFGVNPTSQKLEPAVEATIAEIRGLGILRVPGHVGATASVKPAGDLISQLVAAPAPPPAAPVAAAVPATVPPAASAAAGEPEAIPSPPASNPGPASDATAATSPDAASAAIPTETPAAGPGERPLIAPQTAVWLFRSEWQEAGAPYSTRQYEFVFIHAAPTTDDMSDDPWKLSVVFTTGQRKKFHLLRLKENSGLPARISDASLLAEVHFTKYAMGGLSPTSSVTRSIKIPSAKTVTLEQLEAHLAEKGLVGPWQDHVTEWIGWLAQGE